MFYIVVAAALQNMRETDRVAVHKDQWVFDEIADSSLGRQVDNTLRFVLHKGMFHGG